MDKADDTGASETAGERDGGVGDDPTWASLFERASAYEVTESAVDEALARHRGEGDD